MTDRPNELPAPIRGEWNDRARREAAEEADQVQCPRSAVTSPCDLTVGHTDPPRPIAAAPRFAIQRRVARLAYPRNGNVHNPTPSYRYMLLFDGRTVDESERAGVLREAAKAPGAVKTYSAR